MDADGILLSGDVGGTHVRLAAARTARGGIRLLDPATYACDEFAGLDEAVERYLSLRPLDVRAACFGVPGPVLGPRVRTTTLGWVVDRDRLATRLSAPVRLVNDLAAAACGLASAPPEAIVTLQPGDARRSADARARALLIPGTGLGEAGLLRHGREWLPIETEGAHSEFGPRDDEQLELWRFLRARFGHVSYERICCGPGLVNAWEFHADRLGVTEAPWDYLPERQRPQAITAAAREGRCPAAAAATRTFCDVLGAEAGNLALKLLAAGGVFVGGPIAAALLEGDGARVFLDAFADKGRYAELMRAIPVHVIRNGDLGLLGAATIAARLV